MQIPTRFLKNSSVKLLKETVRSKPLTGPLQSEMAPGWSVYLNKTSIHLMNYIIDT